MWQIQTKSPKIAAAVSLGVKWFPKSYTFSKYIDMSFHFKFVMLRFLNYKKFGCDVKKHVSACDRRKPDGCKPKNYFDKDFFCEGTTCMYNGYIEVASLDYI